MFSNENPPKGGFITLSWLVTLSNNKHMSFETVRCEYYNVYFYRVNNNPVILFDGVCNLCSGSVQFILKRDKEKKFLFASLQSIYGQNLLKQLNLPTDTFNSFILFENGKVFTRSTAALKMFSQLKSWGWVKIFWIVPKFIRDAVYNLIAKNRYRWFGKKEECWVPTPDLKARFLD
jgi:predicted DCC family thiol-disulfide oxidoreductase YuxK